MHMNFRTLFEGKELKDMLQDVAKAPYPAQLIAIWRKLVLNILKQSNGQHYLNKIKYRFKGEVKIGTWY